MTRAAMVRTLVRGTLGAGVLGPILGVVMVVPISDRPSEGVSMMMEGIVAAFFVFGPSAAIAGLVASGMAILLARYPANTRTRKTWLGRGAVVGTTCGAIAILLPAVLFGALSSEIIWIWALVAAVSGSCIGALVAALTWPDASPEGASQRIASARIR